jgi:ribose transport system ATP-binding protein
MQEETSGMSQNNLVLMKGIDKTFPGVHALKGCTFDLFDGEVHGLVGENGAGKSTLMKILAGVYRKNAGKIWLRGTEVEIESTKQAQSMGISIIHQELNLMKHLTAAQNIFLGREQRKGAPFLVDDRTINEKAKKLFEMIHLDLDPTVRISTLTVAKQQMVEIAKALSFNMDVLIMDEPTSALSDSEIEDLFAIIRKLRADGKGIVYISHRLEELPLICDRVTVMRDGEYIATSSIHEITLERIISLMVGREIYETAHSRGTAGQGEVILDVRNLRQGKKIRDVSLKLHKGEILGIAGLMGAGRTEVARAIFGADSVEGGEIFVKGKKVDIRQPKDAVRNGIGYLSEDRKQYGLALGLGVDTNIVLASFNKLTDMFGFINRKKLLQLVQAFIGKLLIKTPRTYQKVKNLSGGNQQKVVIAKWLARNCDILIFDEPTRGIDVGAKSEIYKLLNELADEGKGVVMISSELPEILRMSHRILVMCEGRVTGELFAGDATQEKIMQYATMRKA